MFKKGEPGSWDEGGVGSPVVSEGLGPALAIHIAGSRGEIHVLYSKFVARHGQHHACQHAMMN